jgi:hypothetical protein
MVRRISRSSSASVTPPLRAAERLMISKTNLTPQKEEVPQKQDPEPPPDSPLFDLSDGGAEKLIRTARTRGYVTHDQINLMLRLEEVNSEQIEDILTMFNEIGVNVVATEGAEPAEDGVREEPEEEKSANELVEDQQKVPTKAETKEPTARTDDPVRMYLREMSTVDLLSDRCLARLVASRRRRSFPRSFTCHSRRCARP